MKNTNRWYTINKCSSDNTSTLMKASNTYIFLKAKNVL